MDTNELASDISKITARFTANCDDNCGDCQSGNCLKKMAQHLIDLGYQKNAVGKWCKDNVSFAGYYCSACGGEPMYAPAGGREAMLKKSKYCPSCGAKMDSEGWVSE